MENLLPKRNKTDITLLILAVLLTTAIFYLFFFYPPQWDSNRIYNYINENLRNVESSVKKEIQDYQSRADTVFKKLKSGTLQDYEMNNKEALIIEENGIIRDYYGEIYHFKFKDLENGKWTFSLNNHDVLFFAWKMDAHIYYFRQFGTLDNNIILDQMGYFRPFCEIKYSRSPIPLNENKYQYDALKKIVIYSHPFSSCNFQLLLNLKFFPKDIDQYTRKKQKIFLGITFILLILVCMLYFFRKSRFGTRVFNLALIAALFFLVPLITRENFFMSIDLSSVHFTLHSIYQALFIILFITTIIYSFNHYFKNKIISFLFFNAYLIFIFGLFTDNILKSVDFNCNSFNLEYIALYSIMFLLHLLPLLCIRGITHTLNNSTSEISPKHPLVIPSLQLILIIILATWFKDEFPVLNITIISAIAAILLFQRRRFLSRVLILFLLAISSYLIVSGHTNRDKEEFVQNNLKDIFLNQNNYAKFISREIVQESNLNSSDFYEYFKGDKSSQLESIWRRTIASRENIASGIFVVSKDNKVINQFAYLTPFLEVKIGTIFPFWAMAENSSQLQGKDVSLAVAFTGVNKIENLQEYKSEYLGYILVEVINSPDLLLRYHDKINIFTLDDKIDGQDFSYIKLNPDNQIIDNPSNINLENISGILKNQNKWITFPFMDLTLKGYIFKHGRDSIIIFFPKTTIFKDLSEVIKIFLIFSFFIVVFYLKDLRKIDWRSIYYSFSIRVFFFLILIALLTAVVFSIFFINYSARSLQQKVQRMVFENGRIAQNIGYNLIKKPGGFSREHLFSISGTLNSDVSVYGKNGLLIEPSNYRKWINSQIPEYLHSKISTLLDEKNQKFVLIEADEYFNLYFKVYDYLFMVQFSNTWVKAMSEERYYPDFVITLFFIMFIIGSSFAFFFRNRIISPIEGLNHGMGEVEKGNLITLNKIPSELEIKTLYTGFNSMIDGIREQKRSISEISQMKTIIRLGRRVAHEVKNPLTPIKLSAEQILMALKDKNPNYEEIIKQSVNYIIDETDHLKKVSYGFLDLSKLDEIDAEEFDLMYLIHDEMFSVGQLYTHIDFKVESPDGSPKDKFIVTLDKIKMKQVLKNIINNSIEAIGEKKGEIRLTLSRKNDRINIILADNGIGMDETETGQIFEPDYSTKAIGTGLGLFIVKRIIELHKGHIEIHSEKNKGTRVILDIPEQV